jgi:hypothetical protein
MRTRREIIPIIVAGATLFAACAVESVDFSTKTCPCPERLECDRETNRCVPPGAASRDASGSDADPSGEGSQVTVTVASDDFESGSGCDGWEVEHGSATPSAPGRSGARSCRLCVTSTTEKPKLHRHFRSPTLASFEISAWGMRAPSGGTPAKWKLDLGADRKDEGAVTVTFTQLRIVGAAATGEDLEAKIELDSLTVGDCILIDDVVVTRTP